MLAVDNFVISPEILKMILLNQFTLSLLFIVHICMHRFNGKICRFLFCVECLFIIRTGHAINWTLFIFEYQRMHNEGHRENKNERDYLATGRRRRKKETTSQKS